MDYTTIFQACMGLMAAIITCYIIPYIQSKTTAEEQSIVSQWISIAVAAAEQLADTGLVEDKLTYVEGYLENLGISVSREEIEASVYWLGQTLVDGLAEDEG